MSGRCFSFIAALIALAAAGLSTGVPVYYALALVGVVLLLLCFFSTVMPLWGLHVGIRSTRARVTRGEILKLNVEMRHSGILPVGDIRLRIASPYGTRENSVECAPLKDHEMTLAMRCPHVAMEKVGITAVEIEDICGFFRFSKRIDDCFCVARVVPCVTKAREMTAGPGDNGPEAPSSSTEDDASPSAIREWRDGDSLKKVHWKLSMRKRELIVRTYEETAKPDILVLSDLSPIEALRSKQLSLQDMICEQAASQIAVHLQEGYPVRMPVPHQITGQRPEDIVRFVDLLAEAGFDSRYQPEKLLMMEMQNLQRTCGAVVITARLTMQMADVLLEMRRSGLSIRLILCVDNLRDRANSQIVARLTLAGIEIVTAQVLYDREETEDL